MEMVVKNTKTASVKSTIKLFGVDNGTREVHAIVESCSEDTLQSWQLIEEQLDRIERENGLSQDNRMFTRIFIDDISKQAGLLRENFPDLFKKNISFVGQAPLLNGKKMSAWVYYVDGEENVESHDSGNVFHSNGLSHIWTSNICSEENKTVGGQTTELFEKYNQVLRTQNLNLKDHAIRTWLFSSDVDHEYQELVDARKDYFEKHGLTDQTHYISSTGIEGKHENPNNLVFMDAYSIAGIDQEQIRFLHAPKNLCPTHDYGVTFERATEVSYGDRKHIFISGTASINNKGEIVHVGDVEQQTQRTIDNINALLDEAECSLEDLAMAIVYLRNPEDIQLVKNVAEPKLPGIPKVYVHGAVCRPKWLVEIEGIAIKETNSKFKNF